MKFWKTISAVTLTTTLLFSGVSVVDAKGRPTERIVLDSNGIIYSMNPDGTDLKQIVNGYSGDVSTDGRKLVYTKYDAATGKSYIAVSNTDGTQEQILTEGSTPRWSKDGSKIVFSRREATGEAHIWIMSSDGSNQVQITNKPGEWAVSPDLSPDGQTIVFEDQHIYSVRIDGTGIKQLTTTSSPYGMYEGRPRWSLDGTKILYVVFQMDDNHSAYVMNADGSNPTKVNQLGGWQIDSIWSPDGTKIAFSSVNGQGYNEPFNITTLDGTHVYTGQLPLDLVTFDDWQVVR